MREKPRLSRRQALVGLSSIGLASAGAGAGTLAYFSDTESVTDNRIESGTIGIDVTDGHTINYTYEDVVPGGDEDTDGYNLSFSVDVANTGSVTAETTALHIENDTEGETADHGMERHILIDTFWYANEDYVEDGSATNTGEDIFGVSGDQVSLENISGQTVTLGPTHEPGDDETFHCEFEVSEGMGNEFQGAELETTIHFALLQDEDQEWEPDN